MPESGTLIILIVLGAVAAFFLFLFLFGGWVWRDQSRLARFMKDPVEGKLVVTAAPVRQLESDYGVLTGMLSAEGVPAHAVQKKVAIPVELWPEAGQSLPVLIERRKPSIWVVRWDLVPNRDAEALAEAERLAAAARGSAEPV